MSMQERCKSGEIYRKILIDIHPVNNTVKYIDKLRGHRRDGKLEHQSAYGCLESFVEVMF